MTGGVWGGSWGESWGDSWGATEAEPASGIQAFIGVPCIRPRLSGFQDQLVRSATNVLELLWLRDQLSGTYPADASVTATVYDVDGDAVTGATNLALAVVAGTYPIYRGAVPSTVDLSAASHTVRVTVLRGDTKSVFLLVPVTVDGE